MAVLETAWKQKMLSKNIIIFILVMIELYCNEDNKIGKLIIIIKMHRLQK